MSEYYAAFGNTLLIGHNIYQYDKTMTDARNEWRVVFYILPACIDIVKKRLKQGLLITGLTTHFTALPFSLNRRVRLFIAISSAHLCT